MKKWRKALALPRAEQALLCEAALRLLQAWAMLHLLPFNRMVATLMHVHGSGAAASLKPVRWALETAARNLPLPLTCLPQAFAACWMLAARGGRPLMHYGVAATAAGFKAHAWVEMDGRPVVGQRAADGFTRLATFPAGSEACR
jgi:hypothetical protein